MNDKENPAKISKKGPVVWIKQLKKVYNESEQPLVVLDGIDLRVNSSEIVAIVGRSGSGKSTLLNLVGGLDYPTSGEIYVNGKNIVTSSEEELSLFRNRHIGFIFQFHHLLSEFTVTENIMLPALLGGIDEETAYKSVAKLLEILNLSHKKSQKPYYLSGGERQRVAIARALINNPDIILADEPTGNLDLLTAETTRKLLFDVVESFHHTMLIVTHNSSIVKGAHRKFRLEMGTLNPLIGEFI